ncbi:DNA polymerase III subunit alpha [Mycoplasma sp. ATU-Cv-508]|uniref:DNA polymerase III subunit alpha n=1 Tax=Mycoplasma sp. ATU-Cv-508 TaxID=2048001 RepID=UPI000FDF27D7
MVSFTSLHTATEYSLLESTIKIDNLINFAQDKKLKALAITDHNVLHGVSEFIHKCRQNQIKPVVGLDLDLEDYQLILIAQNYAGYLELVRLSSRKMHNQTIALTDIDAKNLFVIDHPRLGYYARFREKLALDNYWVGVDDPASEISGAVYVPETRILNSEKENDVLEILRSIDNRFGKAPLKFKPYPVNVSEKHPAVQRAIDLVSQVNLNLPELKIDLPPFEIGASESPEKFLDQLVRQKIDEMGLDSKTKSVYVKRAEKEIAVINKLGFANYFLIIHDLVAWAKSQNILVGPGRGSAAGSLVVYLLMITEVDPIQFDLVFERFLNLERSTLPDIDIDFQDNRRLEIIEYLFKKYGFEHVALITTFQRLGAKMALRDVGRFLGLNIALVEQLTRLVPHNFTLDQTYRHVKAYKIIVDQNKTLQSLVAKAALIEGLPRQLGTHAAGVVLNRKPITSRAPTLSGYQNLTQIQFSMDYLDDQGLLKIDILGLRNLTVLQAIQKEVQENYQKKINLRKIPFDDPATNKLLTAGDTSGIFQLESSFGMKKTLQKVQVSSLNDVIAIISLYRPGPMDNIDLYVAGKMGQPIAKLDPSIDPILASTYGIIVYQEQIIQIAQFFAGMSPARADVLRWAISKKSFQLLDSVKKEFFLGAQQKGHSQELAERVYQYIEKFADYGFNKSHAVAYAMLAYRLAYLKARFPVEFYTAIINSSLDSPTMIRNYINEAKSKSILTLGPDIVNSLDTTINQNKNLILPLTIVKGVGQAAYSKIIQARQLKPFKSLLTIIEALKIVKLSDSVTQSLVKADAFRTFLNSTTLMHNLSKLLRYASMVLVDGKVQENLAEVPEIEKIPPNNYQQAKWEVETTSLQVSNYFTSPYEGPIKLINLPLEKATEIVVWLEKRLTTFTKDRQRMECFT